MHLSSGGAGLFSSGRQRVAAQAGQAFLTLAAGCLQTAERVLQRLGADGANDWVYEFTAEIDKQAAVSPIPKVGFPRPPGIPTTREMIDEVLAAAEADGKPGLNGRDLTLAIGVKWWPGLGWNSVIPDASRLVKGGKLVRIGKIYARTKSVAVVVGQLDQETKENGAVAPH